MCYETLPTIKRYRCFIYIAQKELKSLFYRKCCGVPVVLQLSEIAVPTLPQLKPGYGSTKMTKIRVCVRKGIMCIIQHRQQSVNVAGKTHNGFRLDYALSEFTCLWQCLWHDP